MPNKATTTPTCANNSHERRWPNQAVNTGKGMRSTKGAHTNLNEYPKAAQLKNVTALRSTPASNSHSDSEEKINKIGKPAEKPSKAKVNMRRSHRAVKLCAHVGVFAGVWFISVFGVM
jgi:hypothetical protein